MSANTIYLFRLALVIAVVVIFYLTTTPTQYRLAEDINDKLSHALAFSGLALLSDFAFPQVKFSWMKICPLLAYGVLIECIQYFLPWRDFSLLDIAADAAGLAIYPLCLPWLIHLPVLRKR